MTQDPLQVARGQIAEHQAAIAKLEQFVEMYVSLAGGEPKAERKAATPRAASDGAPAQGSLLDIDRSVFASTKTIIDTAVEVLRKRGEAMHALDIYEALIRGGLTISGTKPRANMTAKFSTRKDLLRYTEATGKWSLAEWESKSPWLGATGGPAKLEDDEEAVG